METDPFIGKVINNYRITAEINSGAFGNVYKAEHLYLKQRTAAIKLLHIHLKSPKERELFAQEAQILAELKHPHILPLTDFGFNEGHSYMIADYAAGGSLHDLLRRQSPLPINKALTILEQMGQALHHAHSYNIIHRDLKPANILFDAQEQSLLADFGIASILAASVKQSMTIAGTPLYMAPEQFRGTISKEGDQYALACIAYELLTGRPPFQAPDFFSMGYQHQYEQPIPPSQLNAQVMPATEVALLKALSKQRTERHTSVEAFVLALREPFVQPTVIVQPSPGKTKEEWIRIGNDHYNVKRYNEALTAYEQALRLDPNYTFAHNGKGNALHDLKRYNEALLASEQALRLDPNYTFAHNSKGNALHGLKRYNEALLAYDQAIRLDPNNTIAYNNKGIALENLKRYDEALLAYEQAIRLDPNYTFAYNGKGNALHDLKRYKEALFAYEQAIRLDPNYTFAYNGKGNALHDLKRYKEALLAYDQAIRLDPNDASTYYNKGNALSNLKRYDEALLAHDQAIRLDPNDADAYNNKGNTLKQLGRYREAEQAYQQARDIQNRWIV